MDYRYLKTFLVVAKHKNFSKAGEELSIAQSAVSRQIKLLEESVGEQLFVRSSSQVILTKRGKELFSECHRFDSTVNSVLEQNKNSTIKIGILHGILEGWFTDFIIKNHDNFPARVSIYIFNVDTLTPKLISGELDIVFTTNGEQSDLITSLKILSEQLLFVSKEEIKLKNISESNWIIYGDEDPLLKNYKKTTGKIIAVESITAMKKMVEAGLGIALLPDHILEWSKKKLHTQPFKLKSVNDFPVYMQTLNYQTLPQYLEKFIKLIRQAIN